LLAGAPALATPPALPPELDEPALVALLQPTKAPPGIITVPASNPSE